MLLEKLKEEDIELAGLLHDPVVLSENLFTKGIKNLYSLQRYDEDDFFQVRLYQLPFLSYEYLLAEDPELTDTQNFENKKGCGDAYIYCGRKIGKTLAILIDLLLDTAHNCIDWVTGFCSIDQDHVDRVLEPYISTITKHPFFKLFKPKVRRKNGTVINLDSGYSCVGINMALSGREPGSAMEGLHCNKQIIDEHQYEPEVVVPKRSQAISELGTIERFAGITNFTKASPAGHIFEDINKQNWLINLPQTVSPNWNEEQKKKALRDFGDKSSSSYKIHIMAELVENAEGLYDISRIRNTYMHNRKHPIKHFEINKKSFNTFRHRIVVERPKYASRCWIAADFGTTAPTEIIILFELDKKGEDNIFKYVYNISLNGLIPDEQTEIFKFLIKKLNADYIGLDQTELGAAQIIQDLGNYFPKENLVPVKFNSKMVVGYERKEDGGLKLKNGKPIPEEEYTIDWAVEQVRKLFYNKRIDALYDLKLDKQFNAMVGIRQTSRMKYDSTLGNKEDHLHAAFLVFGIMTYLKQNEISNPQFRDWGGSSVKVI